MSYSVENQRFVKINKAELGNNFLGINNNAWKAASRDLGSTGLILYLYFASNMNGFKLAFSPADVIKETGIGKTSIYKYFDIMIKKGYLVPCNGNTYMFNEVPVAKNTERTESPFTKNELKPENSTSCEKTIFAKIKLIHPTQKRQYKPYMWAIVLGFILLVFGIVFTISTSCCKIYVTDKRVYGTAIFGKRVDIPIDSVSAVGTIPLFSGIAISSASGAIKFLYISNSNEIHAEISKLIIARQDKNITVPEKIEMSQSSADELKKFKDLYDSGVISEEEYEAKKKQLLGL